MQKWAIDNGYLVMDSQNDLYLAGPYELPVKTPTSIEIEQFLEDIGAYVQPDQFGQVQGHFFNFAGSEGELEKKAWEPASFVRIEFEQEGGAL